MWAVSSAVAIAAYSLWAFEKGGTAEGTLWFQLSIAPFVLGIFRYAFLLDSGRGGAPEDVVLADRPLQVIGLLWLITVACAVYVG